MSLLLLFWASSTQTTASNTVLTLPVNCVLAGENPDKFKPAAGGYSARQIKSIFGEK